MNASENEQRLFWQWITQNTSFDDDQAAINDLFLPHSHLSQSDALSIYNNAYHSRLVDVSKQLYPITYNSLGDDVYRSLWIDYLSEYPPKPGSINFIGEKLPTFLFEHQEFRKLPALVDIVKLEWLFIDLFGKVDEPSYSLESLQVLPAEEWPQTVWQAKQDWRLISSIYDLQKYWRQVQEFYVDGITAGSADFAIETCTQPQRYLVRRNEFDVQFEVVSEQQWIFLEKIKEGKQFAHICDVLAQQFPEEDVAKLSLELLLKSIELKLITLSETSKI